MVHLWNKLGNLRVASISYGVEEFWQYGSDEVKQTLLKQDGVAPQKSINGVEKLSNSSKPIIGGRAYIPDEVPQGWFLSHSIGNYGWIFEKKVDDAGYIKPRK